MKKRTKRKIKGALKSKSMWLNVVGVVVGVIVDALTGGVGSGAVSSTISANPLESLGTFGGANALVRLKTDSALEDKVV